MLLKCLASMHKMLGLSPLLYDKTYYELWDSSRRRRLDFMASGEDMKYCLKTKANTSAHESEEEERGQEEERGGRGG